MVNPNLTIVDITIKKILIQYFIHSFYLAIDLWMEKGNKY